ncbi:unnamed protein product [Ambrosiozyma monospora]|uniref:Unnamed protein product n=1 Tax=Ambrosiozyma monospora TaxID=43982 RepID=A0ACB5UAD0_AMBMO|nr:unnamed protein product [Ambrosiozyma monospora]
MVDSELNGHGSCSGNRSTSLRNWDGDSRSSFNRNRRSLGAGARQGTVSCNNGDCTIDGGCVRRHQLSGCESRADASGTRSDGFNDGGRNSAGWFIRAR